MRQLLLVGCLLGWGSGCGRNGDERPPAKGSEMPPVSAAEVNARLPEGMMFDGERFFGRTGNVAFRLVPKTNDWVWTGRMPVGLVENDAERSGDVLRDGRLEEPSGLITNDEIATLGPHAFAAINEALAAGSRPSVQVTKLYREVASVMRPADELVCVIPPTAGRRGLVVAVANKRTEVKSLPVVRCAGWFTKAGGDWRVDAWHEFMTQGDYGDRPRTNYMTATLDFRERGFKSWSVYPEVMLFQDVSSANGIACGLMKRAAERLAVAGY